MKRLRFRAVDRTGYLTRLENYPTLGKTPRFMGIAPGTDLLYVANETTDNITEFRLNESNQRLEYTGRMICTESPVCITFVNERKE
jgi:6-phosphogluconolactonase (cycloisomerase 2 family)